MVKKSKKRVVKKAKAKAAKVILPTKMSKLIGIALTDLKKAEKQSHKYAVDMGDWYNPNAQLSCKTPNGAVVAVHKVCTVCFAGAVMAFSLPKPRSKGDLQPENFRGNRDQLLALNSLRLGHANAAGDALGLCAYGDATYDELGHLNTNIPDYDALNPKPFHDAMVKFKTKLAKAGY